VNDGYQRLFERAGACNDFRRRAGVDVDRYAAPVGKDTQTRRCRSRKISEIEPPFRRGVVAASHRRKKIAREAFHRFGLNRDRLKRTFVGSSRTLCGEREVGLT
jgi:hypothetical protein